VIGYLNLLAFIIGYAVIALVVVSCVVHVVEAAFYGVVMTRLLLVSNHDAEIGVKVAMCVMAPFVKAWDRLFGAAKYAVSVSSHGYEWRGGWKIHVIGESK
jgi:hypothetical protein